ncbi:MAG: hypothetical protein KDA78_00770 [Planctomycetaceae bacterium]|nr:hypothetical protein [Planctomycetaceae bacterium]
MKRSLVFILFILATTAARAADIGTTYVFTPDLSREGNPLMTALGFTGIIVLNSILLLVVSLLLLYWYRYPLQYRLPSDEDNVWAFASLNYFGEEHPSQGFALRFLSRNPRNWLMAAQMVAIQLPVVLVVGSSLAVFSWFAIHHWHWSWYNTVYGKTHFAFPYVFIIPFYVAATRWYFRNEHRRTLNEQNDG